jgi:ribosome-binding factor A
MKKPIKNTNRIAKVNSLIEHELGPVLHEFLAGEKGLTTISKVETSRDMKWVKVWISIFGGDDKKILKYINENIYEIQGAMNKNFATKIIPRLQFFLDTSPRYAQHISELVEKIHEEDTQDSNIAN